MAKAAVLADGVPLPPLALRGQPGMAVLLELGWRAGGNTQLWTGLAPSDRPSPSLPPHGCVTGSRLLMRCEDLPTHTHTHTHTRAQTHHCPRSSQKRFLETLLRERKRREEGSEKKNELNEENGFAGGGVGH